MGSGDHKIFPNLHLHVPHHHHHHHGKEEAKDMIPKGCLPVVVGQGAEKQLKVIIPLIYINHPLFMKLLREAEKEYGFQHNGPISIPCHVDEFRHVQNLIEKSHHHHHHHLHHLLCFT